jgi:hypothetical protein
MVAMTKSALLALLSAAPAASFAECPVTLPSSSPVIVPDEASIASHAWFGSEALAIRLPADGIWRGMGPEHHYRDKLWFWRRGYSARSESRPALTLHGLKLGGGAEERLHIADATNAFGPGWDRMLVGMEFPTAGCWRVTATYLHVGIESELTFVVEVVDSTQGGREALRNGPGETMPGVEIRVVDAHIHADATAAADERTQQGR